jgi:fumarate reductase iron-sulfur subunit
MNITHLKLREIQAPLASSLIEGFAGEIGHEKAKEIAEKVIREDAMASGKALALQYGGNSLAELSKIVKEVWAKDGALKIKMIKETDNLLFFNVTYCGYARIYEKMGIKEMGSLLSCIRDFSFVKGFNPQIELKRTQTIMEGAKYCDFRFKM